MKQPTKTKTIVYRVLSFLVATLLTVEVVSAVCNGHISVGKIHPRDISAADDPLGFWGRVGVYAVLATVAFYSGLKNRSRDT